MKKITIVKVSSTGVEGKSYHTSGYFRTLEEAEKYVRAVNYAGHYFDYVNVFEDDAGELYTFTPLEHKDKRDCEYYWPREDKPLGETFQLPEVMKAKQEHNARLEEERNQEIERFHKGIEAPVGTLVTFDPYYIKVKTGRDRSGKLIGEILDKEKIDKTQMSNYRKNVDWAPRIYSNRVYVKLMNSKSKKIYEVNPGDVEIVGE